MLNIHTYIYVVRYYNYLIFMIIVYKIITVTPKQYYNYCCCCTATFNFFAINGNWENIHFASHIIDPESFNSSKNKYFVSSLQSQLIILRNIAAAAIDQIQLYCLFILPLIAYDPRESVLWTILVIITHFPIFVFPSVICLIAM